MAAGVGIWAVLTFCAGAWTITPVEGTAWGHCGWVGRDSHMGGDIGWYGGSRREQTRTWAFQGSFSGLRREADTHSWGETSPSKALGVVVGTREGLSGKKTCLTVTISSARSLLEAGEVPSPGTGYPQLRKTVWSFQHLLGALKEPGPPGWQGLWSPHLTDGKIGTWQMLKERDR